MKKSLISTALLGAVFVTTAALASFSSTATGLLKAKGASGVVLIDGKSHIDFTPASPLLPGAPQTRNFVVSYEGTVGAVWTTDLDVVTTGGPGDCISATHDIMDGPRLAGTNEPHSLKVSILDRNDCMGASADVRLAVVATLGV